MEAFKYFSIGFDKLKEAMGASPPTENKIEEPKAEKRMVKNTEAIKPVEGLKPSKDQKGVMVNRTDEETKQCETGGNCVLPHEIVDLGNPAKERMVKQQQESEIKINKTEDKMPEHVQAEQATIEKEMTEFLNKTQDQRIKEKWAEFDKMANKENERLENKNRTVASSDKALQKEKVNKTAKSSDLEKDVLMVEPLFKTKIQIKKNETAAKPAQVNATAAAPKNTQANIT